MRTTLYHAAKTRFYVLQKGDRFKFENDVAEAFCLKTGPETYVVESASDRLAVGLKCTVRAGCEVFRLTKVEP